MMLTQPFSTGSDRTASVTWALVSIWAEKTGCVALYAARIRFLAKNIVQAQEFGATPGSDNFPWRVSFQRRASEIYQATLPEPYLRRLCSIFLGCSLTMDEQTIPNELGEDWHIVQSYFDTAAEAITGRVGLLALEPEWDDPSDQEPTTPGVVRFDQLATFTSKRGLDRMIEAATNVSQHLAVSQTIAPERLMLLRDLAAGHRIVDIANAHGWSERHLYREFKDLWRDLGVNNRQQGIALAAQSGWLS